MTELKKILSSVQEFCNLEENGDISLNQRNVKSKKSAY